MKSKQENFGTGSHDKILMVAGPTASGKTSLALRLAEQLNGELVGIDSVQVYQGCDIGSAKASPQQLDGAAHHMIDLCPPDQDYNVARFVNDLRGVVDDIQRRGKLSVLCGGTTLYITCCLHGLAELPSADNQLRETLSGRQNSELFELLSDIDPESAEKLHPNDRLRIIRALEGSRLSGRPISDMRQEHSYRSCLYQGLILVLLWPRHLLYQRIDQRSNLMIEQGLVNETQHLINEYGRGLRVLKSVGYSQVCQCLDGQLCADDLSSDIAKATRRLAKRQMTFWRNEPDKRGWIKRPTPDQAAVEIGAEAEHAVQSAKLKGFRAFDFNFQQLQQAVKARLNQEFDALELWYVNAEKL